MWDLYLILINYLLKTDFIYNSIRISIFQRLFKKTPVKGVFKINLINKTVRD